jgi:hypothetical protein
MTKLFGYLRFLQNLNTFCLFIDKSQGTTVAMPLEIRAHLWITCAIISVAEWARLQVIRWCDQESESEFPRKAPDRGARGGGGVRESGQSGRSAGAGWPRARCPWERRRPLPSRPHVAAAAAVSPGLIRGGDLIILCVARIEKMRKREREVIDSAAGLVCSCRVLSPSERVSEFSPKSRFECFDAANLVAAAATVIVIDRWPSVLSLCRWLCRWECSSRFTLSLFALSTHFFRFVWCPFWARVFRNVHLDALLGLNTRAFNL